MLSLRLYNFTCVCILTVLACVSVVTTETVVGVAGRKVTLPCYSEAMTQRGVEVCWGRGEPTLFTCHNTLINLAAGQVSYRRSYRYSVSSTLSDGDSSLSILNSRPSDSARSVVSDSSVTETPELSGDLNTPRTTTTGCVMEGTGSDVTGDDTVGPVVALVQSPVQQVNSLHIFIGHTLRLSVIIFIPALLLTAAYSVVLCLQESGGPIREQRLTGG
ncbi:hypothetical protein PAMP_006520 [Pampus punctatissimus]